MAALTVGSALTAGESAAALTFDTSRSIVALERKLQSTSYPSHEVSMKDYPNLPGLVGAHTCRQGDWIREIETGHNFLVVQVERHATTYPIRSNGKVILRSEDGCEITVTDDSGGARNTYHNNPESWLMARRFAFLPPVASAEEISGQVGDLVDLKKLQISAVVGAADARKGDVLVCTNTCSADYPGYSSGIQINAGNRYTVVSAVGDSVTVQGLNKHSIVLSGENLRNFARLDKYPLF